MTNLRAFVLGCAQRHSQMISRVRPETHSCGHNHSNQCKTAEWRVRTSKSVAALPHVPHPGYASGCAWKIPPPPLRK